MTESAFEKLDGKKKEKFLERLNAAWSGSPFNPESTVVHARGLSFFPGWVLVEASDATIMPEKKCAALDNGSEAVPVPFDAAFIADFAREKSVTLSRGNACDYVRFWAEYTRPGAERFLLIDTVEDLPWREEPTPQARKSLAQAVMPLTLTGADAGGYTLQACILFRDALFDCSLHLSQTGAVAIAERDMLIGELTVTDALTGF